MKELNAIIPQMWSVREAADKTNTATSFIRKLLRDNKVRYVKTGTKYLINAESLCDYLTKCEVD